MKTIPKFLTGFHIKLIAIITMLVDHIAAITLSDIISASYSVADGSIVYGNFKQQLLVWVAENHSLLWDMVDIMRMIGRLSFPLFCFLLVQGFIHTKSPLKYALRLGAFALISEVAYDIAFTNCLFSPRHNNVFFTLLTGLLLIWAIKGSGRLAGRIKNTALSRLLHIIIGMLLSLGTILLADNIIDSSYGGAGVLAILIIYLLRRYPVAAQLFAVLIIAVLNLSVIQLFALPCLIIVFLYNGKKGPSLKYAFYTFYPLHLLILTALALLSAEHRIYWGIM